MDVWTGEPYGARWSGIHFQFDGAAREKLVLSDLFTLRKYKRNALPIPMLHAVRGLFSLTVFIAHTQ